MAEPLGLNGKPFGAIRTDLANDLSRRAKNAETFAARTPEFRAAYAEQARLLRLAEAAVRNAPTAGQNDDEDPHFENLIGGY